MKFFLSIALIFAVTISTCSELESDEKDILTCANGAQIFCVTTQRNDSTYSVKNLMDGSNETGWRTAENMPYPDTIGIQLSEVTQIKEFAIDNANIDESYYKGLSANDFELYTSVTSKHDGFELILKDNAKRKKRKSFKLDKSIKARWLKLIILSNWGNGEFTEVREIEAY